MNFLHCYGIYGKKSKSQCDKPEWTALEKEEIYLIMTYSHKYCILKWSVPEFVVSTDWALVGNWQHISIPMFESSIPDQQLGDKTFNKHCYVAFLKQHENHFSFICIFVLFQSYIFAWQGTRIASPATQQIGASVCSENFRVHDMLIWNYFEFTMCSIIT